ncbi:hypothetical protein [Corynebacterium pygosceleis]|uniref:Uncharacterized protein n=1 Tax=Corynebacterium pygosceleis TaxID=2800406 RepID=A0A9Q4C8N8_9CORY|nr:hypothetical protein [Corynebacterium pygosceleis]MCK7637523.1 hypothetical protein [Corynebacterium pygosceleis]MCK7674710.1 hypothetical protein [Corynebacterium pygosceleis]MCL0119701.1 hypothetical protein [Corynebacterium pygosceleis]MCX7444948.1 hypothetical protein [Corynebacterium pygosceleis]MCX7468148.1 hypothetical protein [Corynebacterium pygosceleis]
MSHTPAPSPGRIVVAILSGLTVGAFATACSAPEPPLSQEIRELRELEESGAIPDVDEEDIDFVEENSTAPDFSGYASGDTMSVTHALGTTDVPRNPKVVMTTALGWQHLGFLATTMGDPDSEASLIPLPMTEGNLRYEQEFPWEQAKTLFRPDLILAHGITDPALYERLSDIAPTVVGTDASGQVDTERAIDFYIDLYDDPAARETLWNAKTTYDLAVRKAADALPNLHGRTFTYIRPSEDGERYLVNTGADDPTNRYLTQLGMVLNPAIAAKSNTTDVAVYHPDSDFSDLRADVIFWADDCGESCAPEEIMNSGQFITLDDGDALVLNDPPYEEYQLRAMGMPALTDSVLTTVG